MKILVVGDGHSDVHETPVAEAFRKLGHSVEGFYWNHYFSASGRFSRLLSRAQNKFVAGPLVRKINRDLIARVRRLQPDVLFVYRGTHVKASTLKTLKKVLPRCSILGYNNDDPFAPGHPPWLWRHFMKAVPAYDLVMAYRHHNVEDLRRAGARRVELLRSWFVPERHHPVELSEDEEQTYGSDVVFVGHYEPDDRVALLETIVRKGWRLRLFGPGYDWDPVIKTSPELADQSPVQLVWEEDYNRALCGAKIALCFLSKLNRDTYTRRCFEIPATGTLMLSEYSDDLAGMFREGEEADYFRNAEELMAKIDYYLTDETRRTSVAKAGLQRVHRDGHDVVSRMRQVLAWVDELRGR
jgi:spore maturation protein CgeB